MCLDLKTATYYDAESYNIEHPLMRVPRFSAGSWLAGWLADWFFELTATTTQHFTFRFLCVRDGVCR